MIQAPTLFDVPDTRSCGLRAAIKLVANSGVEERGAVFTRPEVVAFILDLAGYHSEADLTGTRFLEPAAGQGDFLLPAVSRLLDSYFAHGGVAHHAGRALKDAVRAVELHAGTFATLKARVRQLLRERGIAKTTADTLVRAWLIRDDFLLAALPPDFTYVVGNPPYVRQERIPEELLAEYRARYKTLYDRADLYIPFLERGLSLLAAGGTLAYICPDRWLTNKYGGPLRELIRQRHHIQHYVDMTGTDAFYAEVSAYPAIFVIGEGRGAETRVVRRPPIDAALLRTLASAMAAEESAAHPLVTRVATESKKSSAPLVLKPAADERDVLHRLERTFLPLEAAGCKVGIGVATGCDNVYISRYDRLDVEPERKLPLVMAPDIRSGMIRWSGKGIVNPFLGSGELARFEEYPRFAAYLRAHEATLRKRHVAQQHPTRWYRTIDRIYPALISVPKLLVPDIKGIANVVYDPGSYYPHHNLYYVTSHAWDLEALQAILRSDVALFFVAAYSVRMRGDYLRFQAQYLRRIHVPNWDTLPEQVRSDLIVAARSGDRSAINASAIAAYQLTDAERACILQATSREQTGKGDA